MQSKLEIGSNMYLVLFVGVCWGSVGCRRHHVHDGDRNVGNADPTIVILISQLLNPK